MEKIPNRKEIIDRRALVLAIAEIAERHSPSSFEFRRDTLKLLKKSLDDGNKVVEKRFLQSDLLVRTGDRICALHALGPWPEGRPFHA